MSVWPELRLARCLDDPKSGFIRCLKHQSSNSRRQGFAAARTGFSAQPKLVPHRIEIFIQMSASVLTSLANPISGAYLGRFHAVTIAIL
jgi:hypothetical protein